MKIRLSKSMEKCIEEMKKEAVRIYKDVPSSQALKIIRKPTKNKTFEFQIINLNAPVVRIFINGRFYKTLMKYKRTWKEI